MAQQQQEKDFPTARREQKQQEEHPNVRHPGGVILHHKDGASEYYGYGQRVNPDDLADYQRGTLHLHTDNKDRSEYVRDPVTVEHDAHRHAAMADAGQVNSTSDPVPGNYAELNEEEAAQLIMSIRDAAVAARLVLHERLHHGGRQMVLDAASPVAVAMADVEFRHVRDGGVVRYDQTPIFDRERQIEREAKSKEAEQQKAGTAKSESRQRATPDPSGTSG